MHDTRLEDGVSFEVAKVTYPEHEYGFFHILYGWWLAVRRGSFFLVHSAATSGLTLDRK